MSRALKITLGSAAVLALAALLYFQQGPPPAAQAPAQAIVPAPVKAKTKSAPMMPQSQPIASDLRAMVPAPAPSERLKALDEKITAGGYGVFPAVDMTRPNPQRDFVAAALKDPANHPGGISLMGKREPFDAARYAADPSYYLNSAEPGRAFDAAPAGPGVTPLKLEGSSYFETAQGEAVTLSVQAKPNSPVSFCAFDGGVFDNDMSFTTVQAGSDGMASVEFKPTTGVINQCRIRAASPLHSQTIPFLVNVHLPGYDAENFAAANTNPTVKK